MLQRQRYSLLVGNGSSLQTAYLESLFCVTFSKKLLFSVVSKSFVATYWKDLKYLILLVSIDLNSTSLLLHGKVYAIV